jgi:hypothetical protein
MNVENFSEWLRRQGHEVVKTESSYWYEAGPRVLQAFPYNWIIQPTEAELRELLVNKGALALRYSTSLEASDGLVSYHVYQQPPYDLDILSSKTRYNIRQGMKNSQIEQITFTKLAKEGWSLQKDTLTRQGRLNSMTQADWDKLCLAAEGLPGFEAWAAITEGELAAAMITARIDDSYFLLYELSHQKYFTIHVNNGLYFVATSDMLSQEGIREVFLSLHSLDAPESINDFKFRMNFNARPVRQRVVFHPLFAPFVNKLSHKVLATILHVFPGNNTLCKAEGMVRFYVEGKKPLNEQIWPNCVSEFRSSYI